MCNSSTARYADFYNPFSVFIKLCAKHLNWNVKAKVRTRLILSRRFLILYRSIDLERCNSTVSTVGGNLYIKVRRKGWDKFQFEKVLSLPDLPELSPHTC